jgi:hypothetical protein
MRPSTSSIERFDQLRASNPDCGFALYAFEPRGVVTLEIMPPEADVAPYQFVGATAEEAMDKAFPPETSPEPEEPQPEPDPPSASVFD